MGFIICLCIWRNCFNGSRIATLLLPAFEKAHGDGDIAYDLSFLHRNILNVRNGGQMIIFLKFHGDPVKSGFVCII